MIPVSLECAGPHNITVQVPFVYTLHCSRDTGHAFQKVVAPCSHELGPHKSKKNELYLKDNATYTNEFIPLRWQRPADSNDANDDYGTDAGNVAKQKRD